MYEIEVLGHFDSAHFLRGYVGSCSNIHGHSIKYKLKIAGKELNNIGILIDFKIIKLWMKEIVETPYDHHFLNEISPFTKINPTAENLAEQIYCNISDKLQMQTNGLTLIEVTVYESENCSATYRPE
jgi:6-pyruvoyltetrahydropterin/6-carboxytetrahydropterin synthase